MNGLMMDYQLNLPAILRRAGSLFPEQEIVTRRPDRSFHRYTYADFIGRAHRFAVALKELGLKPGERVGTLCWNSYQHLEAYFGIPAAGGVVHTINPRLHPDDLSYIIEHAGDRVLLVDETIVPVFESFRDRVSVEHVIVVPQSGENLPDGTLDYEELLSAADEERFEDTDPDERSAAAMCYTSGTTGRPKGVLYDHRSIIMHSLNLALADTLGIREQDTVLPVVPMFHVNAWGMPFVSTMIGAKQVLPGPHLDPESLLEDFEQERVTLTAGVPTVFLPVLQALDQEPDRYDLSALRAMAVGGSAAPKAMIQGYRDRHGLSVVHAWGMTEMSPVGTVASLRSDLLDEPQEVKDEYLASQGYSMPFVEVRARGAEGMVPWDGESYGELEVRGPSVASSYYEAPEGADKFTEDGWFKTGDIVTIDRRGYVTIQDRSKDVIKSGGEWISSVALENALMAHSAVAEAAVISIPDERWQERPLAVVVLQEGESVTGEELKEHLRPDFASFWIPDAVEFVEEIPRTATGKFLKMNLRQQFEGYVRAE